MSTAPPIPTAAEVFGIHDASRRRPSGSALTGRTSTGQGYDTNPAAIAGRLDEWAAKLDELSSEYADVAVEAATKRVALEYEKAVCRERAKRRPNPRDRRTTADLAADVARSAEVHPLELEVVELEARLGAIRVLLDNAKEQIGVLRTHEASARVFDPRRPGQ